MNQPSAQPFAPSPRLPKEQLLQVLRVASGVQTVWSTDRRGVLGAKPGSDKAWLLVSVSALSNDGTDEARSAYDPKLDENQFLQGGWRSCVVSLRAVSIDPKLEAFDLLGRVRFQLRTSKCQDLFAGVLALHEIHPIVTMSEELEDRVVLAAVMDVGFGYVEQADPLDPEQGGYATGTDAVNNGTLIP